MEIFEITDLVNSERFVDLKGCLVTLKGQDGIEETCYWRKKNIKRYVKWMGKKVLATKIPLEMSSYGYKECLILETYIFDEDDIKNISSKKYKY